MATTDTPDALDGTVYLPAVIARNERIVRESLWRKLRRVAGHIPFAEDVTSAAYCALDPKTPPRVRAVLLGAAAYFVLPVDMIPDFLAGVGFTDDATVLMTAMALVGGHVKERHRAQAREALFRPPPSSDDD